MHLRQGERILKVFRHHPTPFFIRILELMLGLLPFMGLIYFFRDSFERSTVRGFTFFIGVFFILALLYITFVYWQDKLVVTNRRIVYVEWTFITVRKEAEALLNDIQDIQTKEKGVFSKFDFLDYGTFTLKTASSKVTLIFEEAPDPEGIRQYVYNVKSHIEKTT